MELLKLVNKEGVRVLVEEGSEAETTYREKGYSEEVPKKTNTPRKPASK